MSYPALSGGGTFPGRWAMPISSTVRTASAEITTTDGTVLADATSGTNTQTLPPRGSCYDATTSSNMTVSYVRGQEVLQ